MAGEVVLPLLFGAIKLCLIFNKEVFDVKRLSYLVCAVAMVAAFLWLSSATPAFPIAWQGSDEPGPAGWEWVIVVKPGPVPFQVFQVSEHFCWRWGDGKYHPVERIGEAEQLVHEAINGSINGIRSRDSPAPVPEPVSFVLMGTGLAGLMIVRRKFGPKEV